MRLSELGVPFEGGDVELSSVAPLSIASAGSLTWARAMEVISGAAVVAHIDARVSAPAVVRSEHPRRLFGELAARLMGHQEPVGVHPSAVIHEGVTLGLRVTVGANSVVGGSGFGFDQGPDGWQRMPHFGSVRLGDGVTVGSNTSIDRGTLGDTIVGVDCHIDNLVHVAHNVILERGVMVVAGTVLGGSVHVGEWAWVGMGARIGEGLTVGAEALIGSGAVVTKDVPAGATVVGVDRIIDSGRSVKIRLGYSP